MFKTFFMLCVFIVLSVFLTREPAHAHGGHDPRLKIAANDSEIRVETSLNFERFLKFDLNADGALSVYEFENQYDIIAKWIDQQLQLNDQSNQAIIPYFSDSLIIDRANLKKTDAVQHIKILRRYKIMEKSKAYTLVVSLFDREPQILYSKVGKFSSLPKFTICITPHSGADVRTCRSP